MYVYNSIPYHTILKEPLQIIPVNIVDINIHWKKIVVLFEHQNKDDIRPKLSSKSKVWHALSICTKYRFGFSFATMKLSKQSTELNGLL